MKISRTILCVDAGFRNTGIAVWDIHRQVFTYTVVLSFPPSSDRYVLLESARVVRLLSRRLATIIRERRPLLTVAELPFGGARNSRAATCMALACAAVVSTCELMKCKLHPIRPQEIKKWVSGHGNRAVSKEEVIQKVTAHFGSRLLPQSGRAEHVADAMAALAVWRENYAGK